MSIIMDVDNFNAQKANETTLSTALPFPAQNELIKFC